MEDEKKCEGEVKRRECKSLTVVLLPEETKRNETGQSTKTHFILAFKSKFGLRMLDYFCKHLNDMYRAAKHSLKIMTMR